MAKLTRDSLIKQIFNDTKNYPYGFSRSGDFSISESKALAQYGCLICELVDGNLEPETDDDKAFLAAALGRKSAETMAEKAWVKYQNRINRPKLASINGSQHPNVSNSDEVNEGIARPDEVNDL